jgi:hypothetical protein
MQTQEIEVTIQPDGSTKLHVRGVAGATCLTLTEELIKALGGQIIAHETTPEYDQPIEQSDSAWQSLGQ